MLVFEADAALEGLLDQLSGSGLRAVADDGLAAQEFRSIGRGFDTALPVAELAAIAGSPAAIHGAASIVREYLRSKNVKMKIQKPDGSSVEIEGSLDLAELEKIIDAASADLGPQQGSS